MNFLYFLKKSVTRLEKCENAFWEFGTNLPKEYKEFLNDDEKIHLTKYKALIQNYSQSLEMDIDLTKVPKKNRIASIFFRI